MMKNCPFDELKQLVADADYYEIEVAGVFPGLNKILNKAKTSYIMYSELKKKYTGIFYYEFQVLPKMEQIVLGCKWYDKSLRRDPDNIESAVKFVLDGLVRADVIENDGHKHVKGIFHVFGNDKKNPRVLLNIYNIK
ncbi:MAG: hypothetical protein ABEK36_04055 [Candidatus Aenigmatarchaeota archaeon]